MDRSRRRLGRLYAEAHAADIAVSALGIVTTLAHAAEVGANTFRALEIAPAFRPFGRFDFAATKTVAVVAAGIVAVVAFALAAGESDDGNGGDECAEEISHGSSEEWAALGTSRIVPQLLYAQSRGILIDTPLHRPICRAGRSQPVNPRSRGNIFVFAPTRLRRCATRRLPG